MIRFISDNYLLCVTFLYVMMTVLLCIKLGSADREMLNKNGRIFSEMPIKQRHKILFKGTWVKIIYVLLTLIFMAVMLCRLINIFSIIVAVLLSLIIAPLTAFLFFELMLLMSALLRRIISVRSAALNMLLSSALLVNVIMLVNLYNNSVKEFYSFLLAQFTLALCYAMLTVVLILILKEANDENSELTFANIWKSAFLTIILFISNLTLMSAYCLSNNPDSVKGANGVFDVLYYTVITFATVGYGDITPVSTCAKAVSVLTVITSILCITVLLSEIVGVKKKKKIINMT